MVRCAEEDQLLHHVDFIVTTAIRLCSYFVDTTIGYEPRETLAYIPRAKRHEGRTDSRCVEEWKMFGCVSYLHMIEHTTAFESGHEQAALGNLILGINHSSGTVVWSEWRIMGICMGDVERLELRRG